MTTPWTVVKERLVADGVIEADGTGRRARASLCRRCHARTLIGFDGDIVAMTAVVDATPTDALGEAVAQLQGRYTASLNAEAGRLVLNARPDWRIRHKPAGTGRFDVLAEHRCGSPPLPAVPTVFGSHAIPERCPF